MAAWPKTLHCVGVSVTTNPVIVTAEVAVKNAVVKSVQLEELLDIGRESARVPSATRLKNPYKISKGGAKALEGALPDGTSSLIGLIFLSCG
jgi:hypothetical protein